MNERFEVYFTVGGVQKVADIPASWPQNEEAVKSGFWVNARWELGDVYAKRVVWIPPSRIDFMKRTLTP